MFPHLGASLGALHIGTGIENDVADKVHNILTRVPVIADGAFDPKWRESFTCRVWVLEAVERLRQERLIPDEEARELESEAFRLVGVATSTGRQISRRSAGLMRQIG